MNKIILAFLFCSFTAISCKNEKQPTVEKKEWSELPKVISLDSLQQTDFVPTLENPIDLNRNTVYAAAFLYAWDTIANLLPGKIEEDHDYNFHFNLLRKSSSFKNSLKKEEYSVETEVGEGYILAKAFFNKTLPFPAKMEKAEEPILFDEQKVQAFGMYSLNEDIAAYTQVLFYDNNDRFLLKLSPKEKKHEIWLMKAQDTDSTLASVVSRAKAWIVTGEKEKNDPRQAWKYQWNEDDIFSIPEINFNIETHYKELENQYFYISGREKIIQVAYQRTGFILNETGAVAESEAFIGVVDSAAAAPVVWPKPKKLVLDKPFYIILKRVDSENPYFVMRVANAELLVKK